MSLADQYTKAANVALRFSVLLCNGSKQGKYTVISCETKIVQTTYNDDLLVKVNYVIRFDGEENDTYCEDDLYIGEYLGNNLGRLCVLSYNKKTLQCFNVFYIFIVKIKFFIITISYDNYFL
jgi:hypothetical protein